mmetsp:Transcript_38116/g.62732  ORF Transcript_38116/g.62732 Transcript_38116/m.62732 type:complete len:314 (-) Transcript_38116:1370-2311(-)
MVGTTLILLFLSVPFLLAQVHRPRLLPLLLLFVKGGVQLQHVVLREVLEGQAGSHVAEQRLLRAPQAPPVVRRREHARRPRHARFRRAFFPPCCRRRRRPSSLFGQPRRKLGGQPLNVARVERCPLGRIIELDQRASQGPGVVRHVEPQQLPVAVKGRVAPVRGARRHAQPVPGVKLAPEDESHALLGQAGGLLDLGQQAEDDVGHVPLEGRALQDGVAHLAPQAHGLLGRGWRRRQLWGLACGLVHQRDRIAAAIEEEGLLPGVVALWGFFFFFFLLELLEKGSRCIQRSSVWAFLLKPLNTTGQAEEQRSD